jgi:hypothetical protein
LSSSIESNPRSNSFTAPRSCAMRARKSRVAAASALPLAPTTTP